MSEFSTLVNEANADPYNGQIIASLGKTNFKARKWELSLAVTFWVLCRG